jgi:hypothetical protein
VADQFALQFNPVEIPALAARFSDTDDRRIAAAGRAAAVRGNYTRAEFLAVCRWKTARSRSRVASNSRAAIRTATETAFATVDLAEQVGALLTLAGVGMPTAATLLHFAFPDRFPLLDVRALESLGVVRSSYTPSFWASYVEVCRSLAAAHGVSLRTLDKALWQHSKERHNQMKRTPGRVATQRGTRA